MSRRIKRKTEIAYPAVAVFAFKKNTEFRATFYQKESFRYFLRIIDNMMFDNHVSSEKVGLSGYKEDIAAFFSNAIDLYLTNNLEVELMSDTNEFDPDYVPNKFR